MQDWKTVALREADTIARGIEVLEHGRLGIALVVSDEETLLGTVTDGDIRRALISQMSLNSPITVAMQQKPVVASIHDSSEKIRELMWRSNLLQLPILDSSNRIVGLECQSGFSQHKEEINNVVLLMAGGFGRRLRPLTNDIPKPLLPVAGKPLLETILGQLISFGLRTFFISVHYKAEMVRDYFGDGSKWGVNIRYLEETKPLGTGGSLSLLPEDIPDLPLIVMNGDLLTNVHFGNLLNYHQLQEGIATMCVREYEFQIPYGVVQTSGQHVYSVEEKPVQKFFVNAGIYVIDKTLLGGMGSEKYLDMPNLLQQYMGKGKKVAMFPIHEYWLDIGQPEEYQRANIVASEVVG